MPLARYFVFVGSLLLGMLLIADWYLAEAVSQDAHREAAAVDRSVIRINSAHRWPERIVFDTNLPTIVPPPPVLAQAPAASAPREAFARLDAPLPPAVDYPPPIRAKRKAGKHIPLTREAAYRPAVNSEALPAGW